MNPVQPIRPNPTSARADQTAGKLSPGAGVRELLGQHERRRRQLPRALLVGLLAGLVAVAFQWTLAEADGLRGRAIAWAHTLGVAGLPLLMVALSLPISAAIALVRNLAPEAAGSGIPHLEAVLHQLAPLRAGRLLAVKFAGGVAGIGAGLALGREGPTIQMGSAVGQLVAQRLRATPRERQTLIAAGAGAGLSAAFNAPLAGLVFVLEELQRDFAPAVFTITLVASVVADVLARSLLGQLPIFHIDTRAIPSLAALPVSLVLGAAAAGLGVAFSRGLLRAQVLAAPLVRRPAWVTGGLAGGSLAVVGWFLPGTLAGGQHLLEATFAGEFTLPLLAGFFVLRFVLTLGSYATGAPGGIFTPMLVLGATLGMGMGEISRWLAPGLVVEAHTFAVVGMAAVFTAIVRAPLTAIVLMVELTGDYSLVLPLLVAVLTAGGLADYLGEAPLYQSLLRRDRSIAQPTAQLPEALLVELSLAAGAPFAGRQVHELGLPPGVILVAVRRGLVEEVPSADFRLAAGDRVTALVGPHAAAAIPLLHAGTTA